MNQRALRAFQRQAQKTMEALWPGEIIINGQAYPASVLARKERVYQEQGGYVQVQKLSARVRYAVMPLSVVVDASKPSKPVRQLVVICKGVRYRLQEADPDTVEDCVMLRCEEEKPGR